MASIETKIECQCGSHFKFDLELEGGHAPQGMSCPTCGGDATAASELFLDYLKGNSANLPVSGTRALKEIKVACACGAGLKLDLELGEQRTARPVVCASCNADLTARAHELITSYVATRALNGGLASSEFSQAVVKSSPGVSTPAAGNSPMAKPALSHENKAHTYRGNTERSERQKPKPAPAKISGVRGAPNSGAVGPAVAGALGGAVLGTLIWFGVVKIAGFNANWLAFLPGLLAGLGARVAAGGSSLKHGAASAGAAFVCNGIMAIVLTLSWVDPAVMPQIQSAYQSRLTIAKTAVAAKNDTEIRRFVAETTTNAAVKIAFGKLGPATITTEMIASWKETELPKLRAWVDGSYTRAQFEKDQKALYRGAVRRDQAFLASFGVIGILLTAGGVFAAFKIGSG